MAEHREPPVDSDNLDLESETVVLSPSLGDQIEMQKADDRAELTRLKLAMAILNNHIPPYGARVDACATAEMLDGLAPSVRGALDGALIAAAEYAARVFRGANFDDDDGEDDDDRGDDHGLIRR